MRTDFAGAPLDCLKMVSVGTMRFACGQQDIGRRGRPMQVGSGDPLPGAHLPAKPGPFCCASRRRAMPSRRWPAADEASLSTRSTREQARTGTGSRGSVRGRGLMAGGSCGCAAPILLFVAISLSHVRSSTMSPARPPPDSSSTPTDFPFRAMGRQESGDAGRGWRGQGAVLRLRGAGDQATWTGDIAMVGGAGTGLALQK